MFHEAGRTGLPNGRPSATHWAWAASIGLEVGAALCSGGVTRLALIDFWRSQASQIGNQENIDGLVDDNYLGRAAKIVDAGQWIKNLARWTPKDADLHHLESVHIHTGSRGLITQVASSNLAPATKILEQSQ